jgi:hypothetical protein
MRCILISRQMKKDYDIVTYMKEQSGQGWTNMLPEVNDDIQEKYITVSISYLSMYFKILCYLTAIFRVQKLFHQAIPAI